MTLRWMSPLRRLPRRCGVVYLRCASILAQLSVFAVREFCAAIRSALPACRDNNASVTDFSAAAAACAPTAFAESSTGNYVDRYIVSDTSIFRLLRPALTALQSID